MNDARVVVDRMDERHMESMAWVSEDFGGLQELLYVQGQGTVRAGSPSGCAIEDHVPCAAQLEGRSSRLHVLLVRLLHRPSRRLAGRGLGDHRGHAALDLSDPHEAG